MSLSRRRRLIQARSPHWPVRSQACVPAAPHTPFHRGILVHVSCFETFLREPVVGAQLLVLAILLGPAYVSLIVSRIRKDVIGFSGFLDHGDFACRKVLQLLFLGRCLGSDRFKTGGPPAWLLCSACWFVSWHSQGSALCRQVPHRLGGYILVVS